MTTEDVAFLDALCAGGGDAEVVIAQLLKGIGLSSCPGGGDHAYGVGFEDCATDVFGVSGGGEGDEQVAVATVRFHQAFEDAIEAEIVGDGREFGDVGIECKGLHGGSVFGKSAGELRGDVLGIRGTSAVAAE